MMNDYSSMSKPSEFPTGATAMGPNMMKASNLAHIGMNVIHGGINLKSPYLTGGEINEDIGVASKGIGAASSSFYSGKGSEWMPNAAA